MRNIIEIKLFVLIFIFFVTCIFMHGYHHPAATIKKPPLSDYLQHIDGYEILHQISLTDDAFKMLDLDDYTFANYKGESGIAILYIGFYYTANKAYAAHSPLICYPSQGWKIENKPINATMDVGPHKINYEEIVTSFGQKKELVLYWYQSRLHTNTQIYRNKIDLGYNKLTKNDEQHCFVRVSIPFTNASYDEVKKSAIDFISSFYPKFVEYIKEGDTDN